MTTSQVLDVSGFAAARLPELSLVLGTQTSASTVPPRHLRRRTTRWVNPFLGVGSSPPRTPALSSPTCTNPPHPLRRDDYHLPAATIAAIGLRRTRRGRRHRRPVAAAAAVVAAAAHQNQHLGAADAPGGNGACWRHSTALMPTRPTPPPSLLPRPLVLLQPIRSVAVVPTHHRRRLSSGWRRTYGTRSACTCSR